MKFERAVRLVGPTAIAMVLTLSVEAHAGPTKCTLAFDLHEWAALYESATGTGKITCDNGQSAAVAIRSKGGGLSVGKFEIKNGRGSFTDVSGIDELFGKCAATERDAAAAKAADA